MKEKDCVEIVNEKKRYTDEGVYKGMQGWICHCECVDGYWLVNLPQYGAKPDIATLSVHESDMIVIPVMDAGVNERIKAEREQNMPDRKVEKKVTDMKEMDCVEIVNEKKRYTDEGVYKGMQGWICNYECVNGYWLVNLPQYGAKPDIATLSVHESDMIVVPRMDARINEFMKAKHERKPGSP